MEESPQNSGRRAPGAARAASLLALLALLCLAPGAAEAQAENTAKLANEVETKLVELQQKRAQLLVEYTEKYPEVKELDQQITLLEKQIKDSRSRATSVVTTNLETRFREALAREQALAAAFNKQRAETLTQNEAAVNYRIIQQETETNKQLLDGLLQRSKENDVLVAGTPNNIHLVDYAPVPKAPVGPRRMQGVMLALLLSFVFGIALARYLEYLDDTVHTAEDVEKTLRLPALAVIPTVGSLNARRLLPAIGALQKRNGNGVHPELLLNAESRSPMAEAYRHLRTSVLLSAAGGAPQTLLVTSSQPAEGKTTTAVNTALILAQTGATVLIVDADMRRPRMHSIFGVENDSGLSTILASRMAETEMLEHIKPHEATGLFVMPAGAIPPNPAELIGSDEMCRLMTVLRASFNYIVIDSPPIASFTDSVLISPLVDGVVLVVHGGRVSRAVVRRSRQVLQDVGAKILGVVLNNVKLEREDYYYKYYYHDNYYKTKDDARPAAS
jgi:capsular exopolysaccharide synthesis family protein